MLGLLPTQDLYEVSQERSLIHKHCYCVIGQKVKCLLFKVLLKKSRSISLVLVSYFFDNNTVYYIVCEGFGQRHRITVYNYTWDLKWTIGRHGTNDGELNYPFTAIVSDEGNIFILDLHNERASEFHFNGTFLHTLVGSDGDEEPYSMSYYYPHLWLVHGFPPNKINRYNLYRFVYYLSNISH